MRFIRNPVICGVIRPNGKEAMSYQAIIFDLDNTLLNFELCERQAILGVLKACSIFLNGVSEADFLRVFESFNSKYWQQRRRLTPNELIEKSYQDTLDSLNIKTGIPDCLSQNYWQIFNNSGALEPNALQVLTVLSRKYRLAVVTNGLTLSQYSRIEAAGIAPFFEVVVISEAIGYSKPNPEIFYHALAKLALVPTEVLYIGDSLKYDYEGAKRAGIDFCYYNRKGKVLPEGIQPKYVLSELAGILKTGVEC